MVSLILAIVSILLLFLNYILAALVALAALIVALVRFKKEKTKGYNIAGLVISIIVIVISIIMFSYEAIIVSRTNDKVRQQINEINEEYKKNEK